MSRNAIYRANDSNPKDLCVIYYTLLFCFRAITVIQKIIFLYTFILRVGKYFDFIRPTYSIHYANTPKQMVSFCEYHRLRMVG